MCFPDRVPVSGQYMTDSEAKVIWLCSEGLTNSQIAEQLNRSIKTINRHCENIRMRFDLNGYHTLRQFAIKIRPELEKWVK
ncbi:helix-turn-helix domain-containing protein [Spirosoma sp. BT702]|uniref:Helix-turn-helix domain-containing protein n=1 Tax=Spirosoma profusum TaxID=2771354 RepID=A0A927AUN7_9BACT|nr:helix-turn-helix domain-containing protein [Spirosoma profusum]